MPVPSLRYTDSEGGADRIEELLNQAAKGDIALLLSAVNWGEITTVLYKKRHGLVGAKTRQHRCPVDHDRQR